MSNIIDDFLHESKEIVAKEEVTEVITESEDVLNEKAKTKTIKLSKASQINRAGGSAAMQLAKEANDPLYNKYKIWRGKALDTKAKLMKKYAKKGMRAAKKSLM